MSLLNIIYLKMYTKQTFWPSIRFFSTSYYSNV